MYKVPSCSLTVIYEVYITWIFEAGYDEHTSK